MDLFSLAKFRSTKGAVKLHMLLDHEGYFPSYALITEGKVADIHFARLLDLPQDSIGAMDRGYNDYELFAKWSDKKIWFVTRLKSNAIYKVIEEKNTPLKGNIISDQIIRLTGNVAEEKCSHPLQLIVIWDEKK